MPDIKSRRTLVWRAIDSSNLSPTSKRILFELAFNAVDSGDGRAVSSQELERVAGTLRVSRNTVMKTIAHARKIGLIRMHRKGPKAAECEWRIPAVRPGR